MAVIVVLVFRGLAWTSPRALWRAKCITFLCPRLGEIIFLSGFWLSWRIRFAFRGESPRGQPILVLLGLTHVNIACSIFYWVGFATTTAYDQEKKTQCIHAKSQERQPTSQQLGYKQHSFDMYSHEKWSSDKQVSSEATQIEWTRRKTNTWAGSGKAGTH